MNGRIGICEYLVKSQSFPGGSAVKNLPCRRPRFDPWVRKIHWRRKWQPMSVFLPGKSHGQRNLGIRVHGVARVKHDLVTRPPPLENPSF